MKYLIVSLISFFLGIGVILFLQKPKNLLKKNHFLQGRVLLESNQSFNNGKKISEHFGLIQIDRNADVDGYTNIPLVPFKNFEAYIKFDSTVVFELINSNGIVWAEIISDATIYNDKIMNLKNEDDYSDNKWIDFPQFNAHRHEIEINGAFDFHTKYHIIARSRETLDTLRYNNKLYLKVNLESRNANGGVKTTPNVYVPFDSIQMDASHYYIYDEMKFGEHTLLKISTIHSHVIDFHER